MLLIGSAHLINFISLIWPNHKLWYEYDTTYSIYVNQEDEVYLYN